MCIYHHPGMAFRLAGSTKLENVYPLLSSDLYQVPLHICDENIWQIYTIQILVGKDKRLKVVTGAENKHSYQREKGGKNKLEDWDWLIHFIIYKIDNKILLYSIGDSTQ